MKQITDEDELKHIAFNLKLDMFKGIANTCPQCNHKGVFGSIVKYQCESLNEYIICGWCGKTTKIINSSAFNIKILDEKLQDKIK